jgi:hypothetical protein
MTHEIRSQFQVGPLFTVICTCRESFSAPTATEAEAAWREHHDAPQQFDFSTAAAGKAAGIAQSEDTSGADWAAYADTFIDNYLTRNPTLFVDDLWDAGLEAPTSPRALGARMQAAARRGSMVKTADYRPSVRSHLSPKPVWRSLIYTPPATASSRAHEAGPR